MVEPLAGWRHVEVTEQRTMQDYARVERWLVNALSRRLESEAALRRHVEAVETERNAQRRGICWQFTSRDARHKLERLYPVKAASSD